MSRRARRRRRLRDPDQPDRYPAPLVETPAASRPAAPAVVAVVVTRDPGPWLERAVDALPARAYSTPAVLFILAASVTAPTPRAAPPPTARSDTSRVGTARLRQCKTRGGPEH